MKRYHDKQIKTWSDTTTHPPEWLNLKKLPSPDESVEQVELPQTTGVTVNWHNLGRKLLAVSTQQSTHMYFVTQ